MNIAVLGWLGVFLMLFGISWFFAQLWVKWDIVKPGWWPS